MNSVLFYGIFLVAIFLILAVAIAFRPKDAAFTIAIGAVIAANIYTPLIYPISMFGLVFGIDSIVYTIFTFCILFTHIEYGKSAMKVVLYTAIFSIFFTAFLYFMGNFSQVGYSADVMINFLAYFNSMIGTLCATSLMVWVFDKLNEKCVNIYVAIFLSLLVAAVVNSGIYFGLASLYGGFSVEGFWVSLGGSYFGKLIASAGCLLVFLMHRLLKKKREEKQAQTKQVGE